MANDADNVIVAANGLVALADVDDSPTLPTDATTALDGAFTEVGYIDDEGVNFAPEIAVDDIPAWQSLSPVRTVLTAYHLNVSMNLMEWIEQNLVLAFGGGVFVDNADGTWDFQLPAPGERKTYVMVIEGHDGDERYRIVLERVELQDTGDITFNKGEASMFPITVKALAATDGRPGSIYGSTEDAA